MCIRDSINAEYGGKHRAQMQVSSATRWTFALALAARVLTQSVNRTPSLRNLLAFATSSTIPVAAYSLLPYPKDLKEFPAFRTALTQFFWAPGAVGFVFIALSWLQSGRTPQAVWAVLQNAWVVWPTWWSLVNLSASERTTNLTRRLVAFLWLVYLSFATSPGPAAIEQPQRIAEPETPSAPEHQQSAAVDSPPPPQPLTETPTRDRMSSLDMSTKDHVAVARARRGSPRNSPRKRFEKKPPTELPEPRKHQLREVFALFDKKQSGFLTRDDFLAVGRALKGLRWTEACNHERFEKINVSKTGELSEEEFLDFFRNAGMGDISDVVFDSYINEYHEAVRKTSPEKIPPRR
eukprot:TRINITY_DN18366_c0_g1_i3.p1 TRINITY_DN18366_c0_g1~~TRINITY_DN18366_c0_g1_i3.p1  ORF type:complete len:350 (+),score=75.46 TRINITY_DN18366_c0_g1_i3:126-1175(+)